MTEPESESPKPPRLTPEEAAESRRWARDLRRRVASGELKLKDDIPYLKRKLAEEKRKQQGR